MHTDKNMLCSFISSFLNNTSKTPFHRIFTLSKKLLHEKNIDKIIIEKIKIWMEGKIAQIMNNDIQEKQYFILTFYNEYNNCKPVLFKILLPLIHYINKNRKIKNAEYNYFQNQIDKLFRCNIHKIKNEILIVIRYNINEIRNIIYNIHSNFHSNIRNSDNLNDNDNFHNNLNESNIGNNNLNVTGITSILNNNYLQNKNYIKYKIDRIKILYKILEENGLLEEINNHIINDCICFYKNNNIINIIDRYDMIDIKDNIIDRVGMIDRVDNNTNKQDKVDNNINKQNRMNMIEEYLDKINCIIEMDRMLDYYYDFIEIEKRYLNELVNMLEIDMDDIFNNGCFNILYRLFDKELFFYNNSSMNMTTGNPCNNDKYDYNNLKILYAAINKYISQKQIKSLKDIIVMRKEHYNYFIDKKIGEIIYKNNKQISDIIIYTDIIVRSLVKSKYQEPKTEVAYDNSIECIKNILYNSNDNDECSNIGSVISILDGDYSIIQSLEESNYDGNNGGYGNDVYDERDYNKYDNRCDDNNYDNNNNNITNNNTTTNNRIKPMIKSIIKIIFSEINKIMKKSTYPFATEERLRFYLQNRLITDRYDIDIEKYILSIIEYNGMMNKVFNEFIYKNRILGYNTFYIHRIHIDKEYIENEDILNNKYISDKKIGMKLNYEDYLSIAEIEVNYNNKIYTIKCLGIQLNIISAIFKHLNNNNKSNKNNNRNESIDNNNNSDNNRNNKSNNDIINIINNSNIKLPENILNNLISPMNNLISDIYHNIEYNIKDNNNTYNIEPNTYNVIPEYIDISSKSINIASKKESYDIIDSRIIRILKRYKNMKKEDIIKELEYKKDKIEERLENLEERGFLRIEDNNIIYEP